MSNETKFPEGPVTPDATPFQQVLDYTDLLIIIICALFDTTDDEDFILD